MNNIEKIDRLDAMLLRYDLNREGEFIILSRMAQLIGYKAHGSGVTRNNGYPSVMVKRSMKYVQGNVQMQYDLAWAQMSRWQQRKLTRKHGSKNAWSSSQILAEHARWRRIVNEVLGESY